MALEPIPDMGAIAQSRVLSQYSDDVTFLAFIAAIGGSPQELEDAIEDLDAAQLLDTAIGIWLTNLGVIVGEARDQWDDTALRNWIRARVLANKSSGTINEVIEILSASLGLDPVDVIADLDEYPPAAALILLKEGLAIDDEERARAFGIVRKGRPAGVRLMINTEDVAAESFAFSDEAEPQPVIEPTMGFSDVNDPGTGGKFAGGWLA